MKKVVTVMLIILSSLSVLMGIFFGYRYFKMNKEIAQIKEKIEKMKENQGIIGNETDEIQNEYDSIIESYKEKLEEYESWKKLNDQIKANL